jgi:hypothetical protein
MIELDLDDFRDDAVSLRANPMRRCITGERR